MAFADIYDLLNQDIDYEDIIQPVLKELKKESSILEIGCGTGFILEVLEQKGYKFLSGLDNDLEMLKKAELRVNHSKLYHHDIIKPFKQKFDSVLALFDVMNYFENPELAFKNIKESIKPEGTIYFDVYKTSYLKEMHGYEEEDTYPVPYTWKTETTKTMLKHFISVTNDKYEVIQYVYPLEKYTKIITSLDLVYEIMESPDERKHLIKAYF